MAVYGTKTTQNQTQSNNGPRTDYTELVHNGQKYRTLDEMVLQIARERANADFKVASRFVSFLGVEGKTQQEVADALIDAHKQVILDYIGEKQEKRSLFGL